VWNYASRTAVFLAARNKALFWEIRDVGRKNGMDTADEAVSADHVDTVLPCLDQRHQEGTHAVMEQSISCKRPGRVRKALQL
jgi:hypothetical protein